MYMCGHVESTYINYMCGLHLDVCMYVNAQVCDLYLYAKGLLSKCACMHVCVCVSVCVHVCVYVCVCMYVCMYVCWMQHAKCAFENMNVQLCLLVCTHPCISGIYGSQYEKHLYKHFIKYFPLSQFNNQLY